MQNRFLALIDGAAAAAAVPAVLELPAEIIRAAAGDAPAVERALAELARAIDAGEWVGVALESDKQPDALFGLTHTLWLAAGSALVALEEAGGAFGGTEVAPGADGGATAGFDLSHGLITGVLARLVAAGRLAAPDVKALLHELSPVDSSEPELVDPLSADPERLFDTVVAAYLLDSVRSSFDDAYIADTYLHAALPVAAGEEGASEDALAPAARSALVARCAVEPLRAALERDGAEAPLRSDRDAAHPGARADGAGGHARGPRAPGRHVREAVRPDRRARGPHSRARRRQRLQHREPHAAQPRPLRRSWAAHQGAQKDPARLLLHQRPCARGARARPRDRPPHPGVAREDQDQEHLP